MYAIRNKRTRKWVYGTDFRHYPPTQRTSEHRALTWETEADAKMAFEHRHCGKSYEIVPVRLEALED